MLSILSSLYYLFSALTLIAALMIGIALLTMAFHAIFPHSATVANRAFWAREYFYRIVSIVLLSFSASVILHLLIGGGINAH
jgi:hypothetical protein